MNWKSFIAPIGVVLTMLGVAYSVSVPTSPMAILLDAGIANSCPAKLVTCPMHLSDNAIARAMDAGLLLTRPTERYTPATTLAFDCTTQDAGLVVPLLAAFGVNQAGDPHLQVMDYKGCALSACDALCGSAFPLRFEVPPCVRAPADGGVCLAGDGDGGFLDNGQTVFPAALGYTGASCERVACVVWGVPGDDRNL
jgi:hypothetical protein